MFSPGLSLEFSSIENCNSMNNLLSYCGLVDAKIRPSDKDLPVLLTVCTVLKSKGKILQNFVAFSEYMNFKLKLPVLFNCLGIQECASFSLLTTSIWWPLKNKLIGLHLT